MNKDIYWKRHTCEIKPGVIPYEIIEFIYKDASKVLRVDSAIWKNESEEIIKYVKRNWNGIKTSIDNINVIIKVKE